MTRSRPPTDPQPPTAAADPARPPRPRTPTRKGAGVEAAATTRKSVELATPTAVSPPPRASSEPPALPPPPERSGPVHAAPAFESQPIRVISLKAPGDAPRADASEARLPLKQHQPRLRRLSEVSPQRRAALTPPGGLGYLAPPRDPREARTRRWREYVLWGSVAVMVAGVVTLGVWFLAGS